MFALGKAELGLVFICAHLGWLPLDQENFHLYIWHHAAELQSYRSGEPLASNSALSTKHYCA